MLRLEVDSVPAADIRERLRDAAAELELPGPEASAIERLSEAQTH